MRKLVLPAILAWSILILSGCITMDRFQLLQSNVKPKGKKIAVISGLNHDLNLFTAESLTTSLDKYSTFKVISQKRIAKRVKDYPYNIQGPYKKAYFNLEHNYAYTDVKELKKIAKRLNANYIYAMWVPLATRHNNTVTIFDVIGQMYEFPSGRAIGQGRFQAGPAGVHSNCFLFGSPSTDKDHKEGIKNMMDLVAKEIAADMKMGIVESNKAGK